MSPALQHEDISAGGCSFIIGLLSDFLRDISTRFFKAWVVYTHKPLTRHWNIFKADYSSKSDAWLCVAAYSGEPMLANLPFFVYVVYAWERILPQGLWKNFCPGLLAGVYFLRFRIRRRWSWQRGNISLHVVFVVSILKVSGSCTDNIGLCCARRTPVPLLLPLTRNTHPSTPLHHPSSSHFIQLLH
jgi:hypothetical protein